MTIVFEDRPSDSRYIESVTTGYTASAGSTIRPAETNWHMIFSRHDGQMFPIVVGPLLTSGAVSWGAGGEILWIKFKLGTFMPHMPIRTILDQETILPDATTTKFWLKGSAWQYPTYENVETFVDRLVREEIIVSDPLVRSALSNQLPATPSRTVRHRFARATGLTQSHIYQFERARYASSLLQQGVSILDTVYQAGYFDQPHLTRELKRFIGRTPAQELVKACQPGC